MFLTSQEVNINKITFVIYIWHKKNDFTRCRVFNMSWKKAGKKYMHHELSHENYLTRLFIIGVQINYKKRQFIHRSIIYALKLEA